MATTTQSSQVRQSGQTDTLAARRFLGQSMVNASLALWAIIVIFPMIWLVYTSLRPIKKSSSLPGRCLLYLKSTTLSVPWVEVHIGQYFINSLRVVIPSLALTMLLCRRWHPMFWGDLSSPATASSSTFSWLG